MIRITIFFMFTIASITNLFYGIHLKASKMFSPGPLSYAHSELDISGECSACHTKGKKVDNTKYLECHPEIQQMIKNKFGLHSRVSTECTKCHSEHHGRLYNIVNFDAKSFDHSMTGWPLEGKHVLLKCEACHTKGSYVLNKSKCFQCHQDVHEGENGNNCSECHTPNTFNEVT